MKKYTNLSQLITEQTNDATFKIEGRPEDNLLNGAVLKRFAYSYTYPKDSVEIVTPTSILDYISASTEGDANQIKRVIDSLSNPAAVGISADPSNKAGLFGGKNRVEGHVYLFKNVPESSVTSVNPDQLIGNLGDVHLYSNHVDQAMEQISREIYDLPTVSFKNVNILDGEFDYEVHDYKYHPSIKAPIAV